MARHELGEYIIECLGGENRSQSWLADKLEIDRAALYRWFAIGGTRINASKLQTINDHIRADKVILFELALDIWPEYEHEYLPFVQKDVEQIEEAEKPTEETPPFTLPDLPELKSKTCPIYFELKLGKEERITDPNDRRERPIFEFPFLMWTERAEDWRKHFTETPAHTLLQQWSNQAGFHPIVGEPGGGKSTLLRFWAHKLVEMSTPSKQYLPLLVPLREVDESGIEGFFDKQGFDVKPYLEGKTLEEVQPVWLFDGLDELPKKHKAWWTKLIKAQKQHPVFLTCRTALWDSDHRVHFGEPHYLMGMDPKEQKTFLSALANEWREGERYTYGFEDAGKAWVDELHGRIQSQSDLKQLAGSPLLLTLIARINKPNSIDLLNSRVHFYQKAFKELIKQRKDDEINPWEFIEPLSKLAYEVSKNNLVSEFSENLFDNYVKNLSFDRIHTLRLSGVLKFSEDGSSQWLHIAFQEWLLAEYLHQNTSFLAALEKYWKNSNYHEVLTLLWGLSSDEAKLIGAKHLIAEGCQMCSKSSGLNYSGLKFLLTLVKRSGKIAEQELYKLLLENTTTSLHRREAVAITDATPEILLNALAKDNNKNVQGNVALNINTTSMLLAGLALNEAPFVRANVAMNNNTSPEILDRLAEDEHRIVRWRVAGNTNTKDETLKILANDSDNSIRLKVTENLKTSNDILDVLANDNDVLVRTGVAKNLNSKIDTLVRLAQDADSDVRECVARNPKTPTEILTVLLRDYEISVRRNVAENISINKTQLSLLSEDENDLIRTIAQSRLGNPLDFAELSKHKSWEVRHWIANNLNVTEEVLTFLANDINISVRCCVAQHLLTNKETLSLLAEDSSDSVRKHIGKNPNADSEILSYLANDDLPSIVYAVAENPNTDSDTLRRLSNSPLDSFIAKNPNTDSLTLSNLASNPSEDTRRNVAENPNSCLEWF